jgi:hypothetical protein
MTCIDAVPSHHKTTSTSDRPNSVGALSKDPWPELDGRCSAGRDGPPRADTRSARISVAKCMVRSARRPRGTEARHTRRCTPERSGRSRELRDQRGIYRKFRRLTAQPHVYGLGMTALRSSGCAAVALRCSRARSCADRYDTGARVCLGHVDLTSCYRAVTNPRQSDAPECSSRGARATRQDR